MPVCGVEGTGSAAVRRSLPSRCLQHGREVRTHGFRPPPWQVVGEIFWAGALDLDRPTSVSAQRLWLLKWPLTAHACQACPSSSLECCFLCEMSPASCSHFPHNTHFKAASCIPHDVSGTVAEPSGRGWPDANGIESQGLIPGSPLPHSERRIRGPVLGLSSSPPRPDHLSP